LPYSNITLVERILAQALTSATPTDLLAPVDLLKIGNTLDTNQVPTDTVLQYIAWADSEIDGGISSIYVTPLAEQSNFETTLFSNIETYSSSMHDTNEYIITSDPSPFYLGDTVILSDGTHEEKHIISEIVDPIDSNVFATSEVISFAFAAGTRVLRVGYPSPIPVTSARLAAGNLYDKYFMAQSAPGKSDYGTELRKLARQTVNDILAGAIVLHGQHRVGRAFYNPTLLRQYGIQNDPPGVKRE
jgi:hypothetical protein